MPTAVDDRSVAAVRAFNRLYTQKLGVLDQHIYDSPFSLTEARVLYELAIGEPKLAKGIAADLAIDPGYLSRIINALIARGLVARRTAEDDRRQNLLMLTTKGRATFRKLVFASERNAGAWLAELGPAKAHRVVEAMTTISGLLASPTAPAMATLRAPRPGDMGWVVQSHGAIYAKEYGFESVFEGLVAQIVADFVAGFDAARERCWIADIDGRPVGSIFLIRHSDDVAQLRLLLVDPAARGQRLGHRLVSTCIDFARQARYSKIILWTHSILQAARHVYQEHGFVRIASGPHRRCGPELIGETWELKL